MKFLFFCLRRVAGARVQEFFTDHRDTKSRSFSLVFSASPCLCYPLQGTVVQKVIKMILTKTEFHGFTQIFFPVFLVLRGENLNTLSDYLTQCFLDAEKR